MQNPAEKKNQLEISIELQLAGMNLKVQTPYQHKIPRNDVGSNFSENGGKNQISIDLTFY